MAQTQRQQEALQYHRHLQFHLLQLQNQNQSHGHSQAGVHLELLSPTFPSNASMQIYHSRLVTLMDGTAEWFMTHPHWWPLATSSIPHSRSSRAGTTPKLRFDHKLSVKYAKDHRVSVTVCVRRQISVKWSKNLRAPCQVRCSTVASEPIGSSGQDSELVIFCQSASQAARILTTCAHFLK